MPVPPGNRGMRLFQYGIDDNTFQQHREGLFAVSKNDLVSVAQRLVSFPSSWYLGHGDLDIRRTVRSILVPIFDVVNDYEQLLHVSTSPVKLFMV